MIIFICIYVFLLYILNFGGFKRSTVLKHNQKVKAKIQAAKIENSKTDKNGKKSKKNENVNIENEIEISPSLIDQGFTCSYYHYYYYYYYYYFYYYLPIISL